MTEPQPTPTDPTLAASTPDADTPPRTLEGVVHHILWEIEHDLLSPGEVAGLRRLDPQQPGGAAFWKVLAFHVEPAGQLRGKDAEARWALILRSIGELHGLHRPKRRLGRALAEAKVSEMRLARLLRAELAALSATLRAVAHQLASAGTAVDLADLAWLAVTARGSGSAVPKADTIRRRIALDFYRGLRQAAA